MAIVCLCRFWNALFAAAVCVYSFFIVKYSVYYDVAMLSLGVFFLVAFANAHNDIADFEIDKINRPKRPLPSGKISIEKAYVAAFICLFWAVIFGVFAGMEFAALFAVVGVLSFFYNKSLKKLPLIGNFVVALLTCVPIVIPIIKLGFMYQQLLNLAIFAFTLTFAREITKDIEDMAGDKALGLKTFPLLFGANISLALVFACEMLCLAVALFKPLLLYGIAPCLVFSAIFALLKKWRVSQAMLKITMLAGLIFFYI